MDDRPLRPHRRRAGPPHRRASERRATVGRLLPAAHVLGAAVPLRVLVPLPAPDAGRATSTVVYTWNRAFIKHPSASTAPGWTWGSLDARLTDLLGLAGTASALAAVLLRPAGDRAPRTRPPHAPRCSRPSSWPSSPRARSGGGLPPRHRRRPERHHGVAAPFAASCGRPSASRRSTPGAASPCRSSSPRAACRCTRRPSASARSIPTASAMRARGSSPASAGAGGGRRLPPAHPGHGVPRARGPGLGGRRVRVPQPLGLPGRSPGRRPGGFSAALLFRGVRAQGVRSGAIR